MSETLADHPSAEDYRNRAERAEQECAELRETVARLQRHAGHLEERAALYRAERLLILHDPEINEIVQRRLERGKWFIGSEGYARSTALENPDG